MRSYWVPKRKLGKDFLPLTSLERFDLIEQECTDLAKSLVLEPCRNSGVRKRDQLWKKGAEKKSTIPSFKKIKCQSVSFSPGGENLEGPGKRDPISGIKWKKEEKVPKSVGPLGLHSTEAAFLLLTQQLQDLFPAFSKKFLWNFFMSLGFIDGAAQSKVDRGLKMSIEPIQCWQVTDWNNKTKARWPSPSSRPVRRITRD